ncbi:concanavalin A-like lectin protein kinase family protein [Actinidia rufa]|uniref:Concanavalin A-like lectin protein kinase family protein n=1 Tax=Actinidia rufa TaxID=165716 RepID=A0A7J0DFY2_9ERIC|nr:concanavalin A-like lectin protein kinase family protein [Actinidia rufa]
MITLHILLVTALASPPSFNLPEIGPQHENVSITTYLDAHISFHGLQIPDERSTNLKGRAGKATYIEPLHLWDKASGKLADFDTHFLFVIDSDGREDYGDGLAFFLALDGANVTTGGAIGLPIDPKTMEPISPFVAVEFDTVCSVCLGTRPTSRMVLMYDSNRSKNLSVVFTGWRNNARVESGLHLLVDLRDCGLPEWNRGNEERRNTGLVMGLIVGSCALVGGLALLGFGLWKRSRGKEEEVGIDMSMENEFETGSGPKKFSYGQLSCATNNFSKERKLGEGGFGGVYRGFLRDLNSYVAVKRISKGSKQGIKEYASEVRIISRSLGRLDSHLFKGKTMLTWAMRYKIAQGLASALLYLHEEWEQCVLGSLTMKRGHKRQFLAGTMGYLAPECVVTGKASKETDVYSFGVVALEIACGRKPFDLKVQESQMRMVEWVWDLYGAGKLLEAADPKLSTDFDEKEMECLMVVGLWCAHPDHTLRPLIRQAIQVFNFEAPLPILPAKLPALMFFSPPVNSPTSLISLVPGTTISNTSSSYYYNTDSSKLTSSSAASSPSASFLHIK